jgi:hypothetical protein
MSKSLEQVSNSFVDTLLKCLCIHTASLIFPDGLRRISEWTSPRRVTVSLYHVGFGHKRYPPSVRPQITVNCQEFIPLPTDVLWKRWNREDRQITLNLPPYAIPHGQLAKVNRSFDRMLEEHWHLLVSELELGEDELVSRTLVEAIRHSDKVSYLDEFTTWTNHSRAP